MKINRDLLSEINIIPLVDIMLVILIVFMISAPLLTTNIEVELPKTYSSSVKSNAKNILRITIDKNGKVKVNKKRVKLSHLKDWLKEAKKEGIIQHVEISADKRCPYGVVAKVLSIVKEAGFEGVDLLTLPISS